MYYKIRFQKKSHSDYPNPWGTDYFSADTNEEYEKKLKSITQGCEDWSVQEISKELYKKLFKEALNGNEC